VWQKQTQVRCLLVTAEILDILLMPTEGDAIHLGIQTKMTTVLHIK